jgi:hypothetical protein
MENLKRTALIQAPLQNVFEYLSEPLHLQSIWPNTVKIEAIEHLYRGGFTFDWTRKLLGVQFAGRGEYDRSIAKDSITFAITGGLECLMKWVLVPGDAVTHTTLYLSYVVPRPLLRHHTLSDVTHQIELDADDMIAGVKAEVEARHLALAAAGDHRLSVHADGR